MAGLLVQIGAAPAYAAGGSAGSRTSLTLAVRHPEVVKGVFVWEVSGGPRSGELMAPGYYGQYIDAAERGGMAAVAETEFFAQRIRDNPTNRERLLSIYPPAAQNPEPHAQPTAKATTAFFNAAAFPYAILKYAPTGTAEP